MKVILLKDVKKVGKKDQVVEVSDGYGSNYLIPQKLAVLYTEKSQNQLSREKEKEKEEDKLKIEEAESIAKDLENKIIKFKAKAGRNGNMIGIISTKEIIKEALKQHNINLNKKQFIEKDVIVNGFGPLKLKVLLYKGMEKEVIGQLNLFVELEGNN